MENIDNVCLINQMFSNEILFEKSDSLNSYSVELCENYDNLNLYKCSKKINSKVDKFNFIKQLAKIEIRNSLFESYFEIKKLDDSNKNNWTEKLIYNKQNYNIQRFIVDSNSILCFSDKDLDDDSYEYSWINNPFTKIQVDKNDILTLEIAFEISNTSQKEILKNFMNCLNKLELALKSE